ncbi:MAG: O-antigen ligase family protein, partial [Nostoc sp. C3-bin3]|nr:O-antigen ligase family protein [Nostoc sp. C3-bin3]
FLTLVLAEKPKSIGVFRFGLLMSSLLLPLSRSSSALLNACFLAVLAFLLYKILKFKTKLLIPSVILIILSVWAFSFVSHGIAETFAGFFGKDLTLTGRTDIWADVARKIQERPLQGYGFSAFWSQPAEYIMRTFGWVPPNAHNGFLDLALDLGLVGLLLYCLISLRILIKSFFLSRKFHVDSVSFWPFIFFLFTLLTNLTESGLFGRNSIYPLFFISLYFSFFFFPKGPITTSQ